MFLVALVSSAFAADYPECKNLHPVTTDTVYYTDGKTTKYELQTDGYDPEPLLYTTIYVSGAEGETPCLTANLSLHNLQGWGYGDLYTAVKVVVDADQVMYGHTTACKTGDDFVPCVVFHLNTDGNTFITGNSYNLVLPVKPGYHRVRVFFAGVGDGDADPGIGAYVGGTVLTLTHP